MLSSAQRCVNKSALQRTEVRFASFLSGGFTTMTLINPTEKKLPKRTFVWSTAHDFTAYIKKYHFAAHFRDLRLQSRLKAKAGLGSNFINF